VTTISAEIESESQLYSGRIETEIQPAEAVLRCTTPGDTTEETPMKYGYTSPGGDYFASMSDNEVRAIFEQSTMQTQTAERDAKLLANCETQTQRLEAPEPIVILMQEPAKILSTIQTQTPTLSETIDEKPVRSVTVDQIAPVIPEIPVELPYNLPVEELRPESPAKLLLTSETQTMECGMPEFISKEKIYIHKESEVTREKYGLEAEPKLLSDNDTQTHEPSPQLLCNSSAQTKITLETTQRPISTAVVHFAIPPQTVNSGQVPIAAKIDKVISLQMG